MKSNTKLLVIRYMLWSAVLAVMVVIFLHSAQNGEQSSKTSGSFLEIILSGLYKGFSSAGEAEKLEIINSFQFLVRKLAHFTVYLVLGFLCFLAMHTYEILLKLKCMAALSISLLYAISDEIHQLFVPERAGQIRDVLIDFSGALVGVAIALALVFAVRKIKNRKRGLSREKETVN
ncbi:MAG: VanZ family protein [Clostridia bacterium]|nr:VanZ family protein [Clostridia bacterium]